MRSSYVWLLPLSRVILRSVRDGFVSRFLPFVAEWDPMVRAGHDLCIRSPAGGPLGYFQCLALTSGAAVNPHVVISVRTHAIVSLG